MLAGALDWHPHESLPSSSFLEYAFLRWVLRPATAEGIAEHITPQKHLVVDDRSYFIDYEIAGPDFIAAIELDGFEFHGHRQAFTYDRLRQNDLQLAGRHVLRFTYDSIRCQTRRCVEQLQALLALDPTLRKHLRRNPAIEAPEMDPDPLLALTPSPQARAMGRTEEVDAYFATLRGRVDLRPLRACQREAFAALSNYFGAGERNAACVMAVGAGKTTLGVAATLAFTNRRALIVTPGNVIRGAFDRAFDPSAVGNSLYGLPLGPLIPGRRPPRVLTLDREEGPISKVGHDDLLRANVVITNFHSLGDASEAGTVLGQLNAADIDFIVVDEAHIAAANSYQRLFRHFARARTLLMSACFQRMDGRPIDADVVYRYRLIDAIADRCAKNLRVRRFSPEPSQSIYEIVWPDGEREEIVGREAILELLKDERKLARVTAKSTVPIRGIMRAVRAALAEQQQSSAPVRPKVLFSALGAEHAAQIAMIAEQEGIPTGSIYHSMADWEVSQTRARFEGEAGDLQGLVQLKMLGQGYDFPPISIVVPMRPYGSFNEFYQFIGRGVRFIQHPALRYAGEQYLDIIYHGELGLDRHMDAIYADNEMDPIPVEEWTLSQEDASERSGGELTSMGVHESSSPATATPEVAVLFEQATVEDRIVHDQVRVEKRRDEREMEALAQRYAEYAGSTDQPVPFEQFVAVVRQTRQ